MRCSPVRGSILFIQVKLYDWAARVVPALRCVNHVFCFMFSAFSRKRAVTKTYALLSKYTAKGCVKLGRNIEKIMLTALKSHVYGICVFHTLRPAKLLKLWKTSVDNRKIRVSRCEKPVENLWTIPYYVNVGLHNNLIFWRLFKPCKIFTEIFGIFWRSGC